MPEAISIDCLSSAKLTKVEKHSAFSLIQQETYTSYDNCNHITFSEYKMWNMTQPFFSLFIVFLMAILGLCLAYDVYTEDKNNKKKNRKNEFTDDYYNEEMCKNKL